MNTRAKYLMHMCFRCTHIEISGALAFKYILKCDVYNSNGHVYFFRYQYF